MHNLTIIDLVFIACVLGIFNIVALYLIAWHVIGISISLQRIARALENQNQKRP